MQVDLEHEALMQRLLAVAERVQRDGKRAALIELIGRLERLADLRPESIEKVDIGD